MDESEKSADPEAVTGDEPPRPPQPASAVASTVSLDLGKRFGQLIGRYKVVRVLGEGGMGTVFLAEQDKPTRLVALKIIRPGVASANLLRRFEHEAQVLGRLQHPGIAQIYEAGTADTGEGAQPYFVMEYVRGRSLLEYAQASQLGTRQRLELLAKICDAVQHAHQKGIIHRDLKPGNILVTEEGQPKILDFGVARATDADIQVTTIHTDVGQLVGTIPYMSPEQAGGDVTELDTRSDVYALGVMGYELLAGRLPYELSNKMIHEAVRVIREDDPTPLSSIDRVFRGDVETIIAKALQKERTRRYQSASDLAGDIRRYLTDQPIVARPPSVGYQLSKFTKRNKALVAGVAAVFVVLVGGIVTTSVALAREAEQHRVAQHNAKEAREAQALAEEREQEAEDARALAKDREQEAETQTYYASIFAARVALQDNNIAAVRRFLDRAPVRHLNWEWGHLNAKSDRSLTVLRGHHDGVRAASFSPDGSRIVTASWDGTARVWHSTPWRERRVELVRYREAIVLVSPHIHKMFADDIEPSRIAEQVRYNQSLTDVQRRAALNLVLKKSDEPRREAYRMNNLATLYGDQGRYNEAESLYVKTLEISKRVLGEEHPITLRTMSNLVKLYSSQGRMNDARSLVRALQEIERPRADRPGASARDKNDCAWNLLTCEPADLRDPETALRLAREASDMTNHANPAILRTLALAQHLTGDTAVAIETEKKALSLVPADAPWRGPYEAALAKFEAALEDESK